MLLQLHKVNDAMVITFDNNNNNYYVYIISINSLGGETCVCTLHTIIREIFVVKKFSFHPKQRKFLTRILLIFTNSIIRSEYMAHVK